MSRPLVHVLGCGRAARVVVRWLSESGQVDVGQICNRSLDSARSAVDFIGSGQAVEQLDESITAGWLLLGLPDGQLEAAVLGLACRMPGQAALAFHLSGSMPSAVLEPLGVPFASVHPVRAFARPESALAAMPGTWCVAEGNAAILVALEEIFSAAGGRWLTLEAAHKARYHAAMVAASNLLVTLTDLSRRLAISAGLPAESAAAVLHSLQQGALDNLADSPAAEALTGPVERSDPATCQRLLEAVAASEQDPHQLFRILSLATLDLAVKKRGQQAGDPDLHQLLSTENPSS